MLRTLVAAAVCVGPLVLGPGAAHGETYPTRPIKVVIPFPAGGPTDGMARIISDRLGTVLGQAIVVENRGGGAGGSIGAKSVAVSDPDGYTIMISPGGALTSGPAVHRNIGYDAAKAFAPIALLTVTPQVMSVHPSLPVKTVAELVAYAKSNPGKISWGTQGFGTAAHLLAELFKIETGTNIPFVPYRGTAPMLTAAVAGEVQLVIDPATSSLPYIQSGNLRALAINGPDRFAKLPDVPTIVEAGHPNIQAPFWLGAVAPAGTPAAIIAKLNAAMRDSLSQADTRARLATFGAEIKIGSPEEFGKLLADELAKWTAIVKAANIQVD